MWVRERKNRGAWYMTIYRHGISKKWAAFERK